MIAGQPTLKLAASVTSPRVHLIANLFDESPDGDWRRISQCTINPELRNGLAQRSLVVPGERYDMKPPCFAMAHHLRAGHRLVLRVTTSDPDKVPMFAQDLQVTVFTGPGATSVDVPVVPSPTLYPDTVPLTEQEAVADRARAGAGRGSVTTPRPAAASACDGVTSQFVEFDGAGGRRQREGGRRGDDDAAGRHRPLPPAAGRRRHVGRRRRLAARRASSPGETMTTTRLAPGTYRIEVHNWAGPAGQRGRAQGHVLQLGRRGGQLAMKLRRTVLTLLLVLAVLPAAASAAPVPEGAEWTEANFPSSDGVKLHADILRPKGLAATAKTPVILSIGPYFSHAGQTGAVGPVQGTSYDPVGPSEGPSDRFLDLIEGAKLMERGYTFVMVDLRGFGGSTRLSRLDGARRAGRRGQRGQVGGLAALVDRQGRDVRQVV